MGSEAQHPTADPDSWGGDTDWGLIRKAAARCDSLERDRAWARLVERYRPPVRRCVRNSLRADLATEDAVDDFFTYLFERRVLPKAQPGQGRFRCYVQGVVRRYALQLRRERAASIAQDVDDVDVAQRAEDPAVERAEEMEWARAVLDHALERLRAATGRDAELIARYYGLHGRAPETGAELARALGLSPNAFNVALHRARERLQEALCAELRLIVADAHHLHLEFDALVERLLEAHPGLVRARETPRGG